MTLSTVRIASLILVAALAVPAGHAAAQGKSGLLDRTEGVDQGASERADRAQRRTEDRHHRGEDQRALSDAVRRVERRTGGQVLSAERVPFDGRNVNRVKVVDASGRVRVYMDDPQSSGRRPPDPKRDDD